MKQAGLLCLALLVMLVGCTAKNAAPAVSELPGAAAEGEISLEKELILQIDGVPIPVAWEENDAVAALCDSAEKAAIDVQLHMYGSWEQVGALGTSIPSNDAHLTASSGDIMLYCADQIVLFYGENTWAYTKLGHMMLSDEEITQLLSQGDITITLAAQ